MTTSEQTDPSGATSIHPHTHTLCDHMRVWGLAVRWEASKLDSLQPGLRRDNRGRACLVGKLMEAWAAEDSRTKGTCIIPTPRRSQRCRSSGYYYLRVAVIVAIRHPMHKISKVFSSLTRPCDESSPSRGGLTSDDHDAADRRGAVTVGRTVSWDRGADPHTWRGAAVCGGQPAHTAH